MQKTDLPFVSVNMAMTADGKIATANRMISSFGSAHDQDQLLRLRSQADAVMAGARTVDQNSITLGPGPSRFRRIRLNRGLAEYNLRIVVSGSGSIDPKAEIFRHRFSPIVILTTERAKEAVLRRLRSVAHTVRVCGREAIDFRESFQWLRKEWQIEKLLCEGGAELNGALFSAGLVDELNLTICPKIFGGAAAPTVSDGLGARTLSGASQLGLKSMKRTGSELFLVYGVFNRILTRSPASSIRPSARKAKVNRTSG